jgi:DNA adenine methylase Dam
MAAQYAQHFFPPKVTRFVDLFAGGLTNTLWVAERFPDAELVINDCNSELITLYRDLAEDVDAVIKSWKECVWGWTHPPLFCNDIVEFRRAFYYGLRQRYCIDFDGLDSKHLSGILLFMLSVNFNGIWKAYIKCNRRYSTPPGTCTQRGAFFNEDNIREVATVLKRATILCKSFENVECREDDFVYADPPYRDCVVEYQGGFTEEHQVMLAEKLMSHTGHFAYSNKDIGDGFYEKHFQGAIITECTAKYTAGRGVHTHDVKEVLVTNFDVRETEPCTS